MCDGDVDIIKGPPNALIHWCAWLQNKTVLRIKMLRTVYYGQHKIEPWCPGTGYLDRSAKNLKSYRSKEPASIWQSLDPKSEELGEYDLHICRFCFLYSSKGRDIVTHQKFCRYKRGHPGKLVYEDSKFRYYEVSIREAYGSAAQENGKADQTVSDPVEESLKLYLQCLSLMGHLFLDTKSICFSVDGFLFYTAVEKSTNFVSGFFSKEKHSWHNYNLACIVIFPPWQKHGLGRRLIQLSYWLIRKFNITGSPEKPLSAHGQLAYESYWAMEIAKVMAKRASQKSKNTRASSRNGQKSLSISNIAQQTGIDGRDIWNLLETTDALNGQKISVKKLLHREKREIPSKIMKHETSDDDN